MRGIIPVSRRFLEQVEELLWYRCYEAHKGIVCDCTTCTQMKCNECGQLGAEDDPIYHSDKCRFYRAYKQILNYLEK